MNENAKKIGVVAIAVIAVGAAIYEAVSFVKGPPLNDAKIIGHGTPGHGMRSRMNALAPNGSAGSGAQDASQAAGSHTP